MSAHHDDYQSEPIRGLPELPPAGEAILWQGSPSWWHLAKHVFHIRVVALYFAGLMAWRASVRMADAGDIHAAVTSVVSLLPVSLLGLGLLALLAVMSSRTTVFTITSRRIVLRTGVALTVAINIPFKLIGSAGVRVGAGGFGDIQLTLADADRIPYATLWPHARPWALKNPEPSLRGISDVARVAAILSEAAREALPSVSLSPPTLAAPKPVLGKVAPLRMPASLGLLSR